MWKCMEEMKYKTSKESKKINGWQISRDEVESNMIVHKNHKNQIKKIETHDQDQRRSKLK